MERERARTRREMLADTAYKAVGGALVAASGSFLLSCAQSRNWAEAPATGKPIHRPTDQQLDIKPWSPLRGETAALPKPGAVRAISRSAWSKGDPIPSRMVAMRPPQRITIHHDGMTPFTSTSESDAARRIDNIRHAHQGKGWGDIGYHYAIDPAGRLWEARPVGFQGAHVRNQNDGNIGICVLGNYQQQSPTAAQLQAIESALVALTAAYRISHSEIYTHQELAATACPGRLLQAKMVAMRSGSSALA